MPQDQKKFNYRLSSGRVVIERAFGQLKGRFRRLKKEFDASDYNLLCDSIMAECVLHDLYVRQDNEPIDYYGVDGRDDGGEEWRP